MNLEHFTWPVFCSHSPVTYPLTSTNAVRVHLKMMPPAFSTSLSSPAFWDFARSNPVHSRMLSAHLFFNLPLLRLPRTVSCRIVFDERETCPYHFSLRFFKAVSRSLWGLIVVIQKHKITALFLLVIIYRSTRPPRYILLLPIGESHIHPSKKHRNVDVKS